MDSLITFDTKQRILKNASDRKKFRGNFRYQTHDHNDLSSEFSNASGIKLPVTVASTGEKGNMNLNNDYYAGKRVNQSLSVSLSFKQSLFQATIFVSSLSWFGTSV